VSTRQKAVSRETHELLVAGGWVNVFACGLDTGAEEKLLVAGAGPSGFRTVCLLIHALERAGIKSLERPIEIGGEEGPDSWVIF
jgi:hypothetical protein